MPPPSIPPALNFVERPPHRPSRLRGNPKTQPATGWVLDCAVLDSRLRGKDGRAGGIDGSIGRQFRATPAVPLPGRGRCYGIVKIGGGNQVVQFPAEVADLFQEMGIVRPVGPIVAD